VNEESVGWLVIRRTSGSLGKMRTFRIILDGEIAGEVAEGHVWRRSVSPGLHQLRIKQDWCGSQLLEVDVPSGGSTEIGCRGASNPLWNCLFSWSKAIDTWSDRGPDTGVGSSLELSIRVIATVLVVGLNFAYAASGIPIGVGIPLGMIAFGVVLVVPIPVKVLHRRVNGRDAVG